MAERSGEGGKKKGEGKEVREEKVRRMKGKGLGKGKRVRTQPWFQISEAPEKFKSRLQVLQC